MGPAYGWGPATHGAALAAVPWQRSPESRFVRRRSSSPIRSGQSHMCPTSSTRRATVTRLASFGKLIVGALAHCHLVPILPYSQFGEGEEYELIGGSQPL